jgi:NAD(P)-dependent dehydrogenase (short-subunit alcohol dehydrogenase family)
LGVEITYLTASTRRKPRYRVPMRGKTALVTGGSTGIGYAVAAALADAGASVIVAGRNRDRGQVAAAGLTARGRGMVRFVAVDVRSEESVRALVDRALADTGTIDFLFNNAGVEGALGPLATYPADSVDDLLATNVKGTFLCLKHVLPHMQARDAGVIVNSASFVGTVVPFPDGMAYGASKAAVLSLTRTAAALVGTQRVRVYAVCPWITDTPMIDRLTAFQEERKRQFASVNPSGTIAAPSDVAGVVLRLFAGEEPLDNGAAVLVDAGGVTTRIVPTAAALV